MYEKRTQTPRMAFSQQRAQANYRKEAWDMGFDEWMNLWLEDDKWSLRGRGPESLRMRRIDATIPWSVNNVIITHNNTIPKNQPDVSTRKEIRRGAGHADKGRPISGDGVKYCSITEAAKAHNTKIENIAYKLRTEPFSEWFYLDEESFTEWFYSDKESK